VGALIDGTDLLATVPSIVAKELISARPHLRTKPLPFEIPQTPMEMLWMRATDDDDALAFVREHIVAIASDVSRPLPGRRRVQNDGPGRRRRLPSRADP